MVNHLLRNIFTFNTFIIYAYIDIINYDKRDKVDLRSFITDNFIFKYLSLYIYMCVCECVLVHEARGLIKAFHSDKSGGKFVLLPAFLYIAHLSISARQHMHPCVCAFRTWSRLNVSHVITSTLARCKFGTVVLKLIYVSFVLLSLPNLLERLTLSLLS